MKEFITNKNQYLSKDVIIILKIEDKINQLKECKNCKDIQIKKFLPLKEIYNLNEVNDDYMRCECGRRPLDIVMSHILKIMMEEEIIPENATLRHNSPVPLSNFYYSNQNPQFIQKDTLILLHPDFNIKTAERLMKEVSEVACVLKGSPADTVGQRDKNSKIKHFKLLKGDDTQINVMTTLIGDKIIISKKQSLHHIEVATTTEQKLIKLHNFLNNNNIKKGVAVDGMCGLGAVGIYLIKYGFEKVIFNDINSEMCESLKNNLKLNNISHNYEIYNEAFEDLNIKKADLCIIDAFPQTDTSEIIKKAEKIADKILLI